MKRYFLISAIMLLLGTASFSAAQDYIVGEGDVLNLTVYEHDDLTLTVRVIDELRYV